MSKIERLGLRKYEVQLKCVHGWSSHTVDFLGVPLADFIRYADFQLFFKEALTGIAIPFWFGGHLNSNACTLTFIAHAAL